MGSVCRHLVRNGCEITKNMDLTSSSITLSWGGPHSHQSQLKTMISSLQSSSTMVDMSLVCKTGESVKCHKIVLAAASSMLRSVLEESTEEYLVVILANTTYRELVMIVEYIYSGQISVGQNNLDSFLAAAHHLQISGLDYLKTEVDMSSGPQDLSMKTTMSNKRRRVDESHLAQDLPQIKTEPPVKENVQTLHDRSYKTSISEISKTMRLPSGIFPTNLERLNENLPTTKLKTKESSPSSKLPSWSQSQLQEAIESVITQQLRFTQASMRYGIPKGTLYDNILGKSKRMVVLDQVGLTDTQELSVLEFCCEISTMPYNRRTSRSLVDIIKYITDIKIEEGEKEFQLTTRQGFRWWWAFTKKHNIISLYYQDNGDNQVTRRQSSSPENLLSLLNNKPSLSINIPSPSNHLLPFLNLTSQSKYSINHPDYRQPPRAHANTS